MGDWHEYFEDFPEENPANYLNGRYDPEGVRRDRGRREKLAEEQAKLDGSISHMIRDGQTREKANRDAERVLEDDCVLTPEYIDEVWSRVIARAGEPFETITGKPFTYAVNGRVLTTSRTAFGLSQSDFSRALRLVPLDGPGEITGLVRGSAYIWAILHDARIRQHEW